MLYGEMIILGFKAKKADRTMGSSMIYQGYTQEMRTKKKHMEYNIEQIQGASIAISLPSESREVPCLPRHCNVWL